MIRKLLVTFCLIFCRCFSCDTIYEEHYSIEQFVESRHRDYKIFTDVFDKFMHDENFHWDDFQIGRIFGMKEAYEEMDKLLKQDYFIQSESQES